MHCAAHKYGGQVRRQSNGMLLSCMALGLILALGGCGSGGARDIFKVLGMAGVMMGPDCALNPISGAYMINEVSNDSPVGVAANAFVAFHSACDGKADVP